MKLVVSATLLGFFIYKIGVATIISTLSSMHTWHFIVALASIAANIFIGAININILLNSIDKKVPFWKLQRYYLTSWSVGLFVPGKIGEFSIIHYLKKYGTSISEGIVVSLADKGITFVVLVFLSLAGIYAYSSQTVLIAVILSSILFSMLAIVFFVTERGRNFIKSRILGKKSKTFKGFAKAIKKIFSKPEFIALNTSLTLFKWMITVVSFYFILLSFGENIPFIWVASIYSATIIISLIPISLSGLGVKEGAAYFLFEAAGINATTAISIYLIFTLLGYAIAICAIALAPKD
ncbi:MAG: lysylphosphatidylglycerol synthase transmembrane domain-containing protein [Nanoarchaeota archaeon]